MHNEKGYLGDWKLKPCNPVFSSFWCELHKEWEPLPDEGNTDEKKWKKYGWNSDRNMDEVASNLLNI